MTKLGNVLPTKKTTAINNAHALNAIKKQKSVAENELSGLTSRFVCGEMRYYKTATIWAIVGRDMTVKWFETRADGDYRI
jgi:hypothetical protein